MRGDWFWLGFTAGWIVGVASGVIAILIGVTYARRHR